MVTTMSMLPVEDLTRQVVRQLLREIAALPPDGQPRAASAPLWRPSLYLRLSHRQLSAGDPLLENSPVVGTSGSRHHLYESFLYDAAPDADGVRERSPRQLVDDALITLLAPIFTYSFGDSSSWLVTDACYDMTLGILALRADEEVTYAAKAFAQPSWVCTNRGLHETMAKVVLQATRHPAFVSEEILYRQAGTFLFYAGHQFISSIRRFGLSPDVQSTPFKGIYAADSDSYADCRAQLRDGPAAVAIEFPYQGTVIRGVSPLNVPVYRIPGSIPARAIRSIIDLPSNNDTWVAPNTVPPASH